MPYKNVIKKSTVLCLTVLTIFLAGCQRNIMYSQTEGNVADVVQRTEEARHKSDAAARPEPSMVVDQGLYVDKTPINISKQPSWL